MFEQLHSINWSKLKTNVGDASHIPKALKALLSLNQHKVERAYWKIDNTVILQGDLSESAVYLPQFLEEALYVAKYKESILELLFQIGSGASLDQTLEEKCYKKVIDSLSRAKEHALIAETKWALLIDEDLKSLQELRAERTSQSNS